MAKSTNVQQYNIIYIYIHIYVASIFLRFTLRICCNINGVQKISKYIALPLPPSVFKIYLIVFGNQIQIVIHFKFQFVLFSFVTQLELNNTPLVHNWGQDSMLDYRSSPDRESEQLDLCVGEEIISSVQQPERSPVEQMGINVLQNEHHHRRFYRVRIHVNSPKPILFCLVYYPFRFSTLSRKIVCTMCKRESIVPRHFLSVFVQWVSRFLHETSVGRVVCFYKGMYPNILIVIDILCLLLPVPQCWCQDVEHALLE